MYNKLYILFFYYHILYYLFEIRSTCCFCSKCLNGKQTKMVPPSNVVRLSSYSHSTQRT